VAKLQAAMQKQDWDAAMSTLDEMAKAAPEGAADFLSMMRFKILAGKKDYPAAFKVIRQVGDAHKDEPLMQNVLAWAIVADKSIEHPDLELARTLAQRAVDSAKEPVQKGMFLDTLARVKFMQGSKEDAVALEQKAMALVQESDKARLQQTLDSYKKCALPEVQ
jgi:tetratricopeptide (TPR) repeat protein